MIARPRIKTALTIDDAKIDQMLYKRIMQRSGLIEDVMAFRMAQDALTYLKSRRADPVDVIFLDINMPGMNGFEFLEAATRDMGEEFARCVVIMLTTSLAPEDEHRARQYKVVKDYLNKPLTEQDLLNVAEFIQETV